MLRRFFSPRHASQLTARRPWSIYRNASIKTAFEYASTPVLARYPVAYTIVQSLKYGLGFVLAAHVFVDYFYAISLTYGISMVPTFAPSGDVVLISKYYRHGRDVQVGDVVSFKHPLREDIRACKRVIGMPGDFVLRDTPGRGRDMMIQVRRRSDPAPVATMAVLTNFRIGARGTLLGCWRQPKSFERFAHVWSSSAGLDQRQGCCRIPRVYHFFECSSWWTRRCADGLIYHGCPSIKSQRISRLTLLSLLLYPH